jgi:6-phosphogluconolactonase
MKAPQYLLAAAAILSVSAAQASGHAHHHPYRPYQTGAVYTMTNATNGNSVVAYLRAPYGALTQTGTYPTGGLGLGASLGNQGGVVLSDDGRWLFVVNAGSNDLTVFAVTKSGLSRIQTVDSGGERPVSVTSNDDLVYVLNAGSDSIAGFKMGRKGELEPIPDSNRPLSSSGTAPAQIQFSPDGRALVVTEKATNRLVVYEVDRDGVPEKTPDIVDSVGQTPYGFSFGKHRNVFVSEAAGGAANASSVSSYHLTRAGDLKTIDGQVPTGLTAACWIVVTPDGRFLYTSDAGSGAISGYHIDRFGGLTLLDADGRTASTGDGSAPIDMAITGNGRFLYALSAANQTLSEFRVERDGRLAPIGTLTDLPAAANGLAAR